MKYKIALIMGSDSDWLVMKQAHELLIEFNFTVITKIISAHRTPHELEKCVQLFEDEDVKVIIAGAGGAAHLPGMIASYSALPVIGVPINATALNGMDSLLSIVQMPKGIPVATVAIDNAYNAAVLAISICGAFNKEYFMEVKKFKQKLAEASLSKRLPIDCIN